MTNHVQPPAGDVPTALAGGNAGVLWAFTLTTFLSAVLLFSLQPMFAKMVLPVLGGSPSVWAVAMCFFQAALLAGYCYAHLLIKRLAPARTGLFHLGLTVLAVLSALPSWLPRGFVEPPVGEPYFWQLGLFAVSIGLPFVAVAANAPLLQAWFAATGHPHGKDPYFLYAASNLGSLLALLSYPILLEPAFGVRTLSSAWTAGFALLCVCLAYCFWAVRNSATAVAQRLEVRAEPEPALVEPAPTLSQRLGWIGLAFVPSALLTAFTTHVTTDIASAPLLWVLPLALYLVTFVLVFRARSLIPRWMLLWLHLAAVVVALLQLSQSLHDTWFISSGAGVAVFFASAMVAHRTLYEARPGIRHLTAFYLWMSVGGGLGGVFAALIAPRVFSEVFEYPLLLALSMACRPGAADIMKSCGAAIISGLRFARVPLPADWQDLTKQQGDQILRIWLFLSCGILAIFWLPLLVRGRLMELGEAGRFVSIMAACALLLLALWRWPIYQLYVTLLLALSRVVRTGPAIVLRRASAAIVRSLRGAGVPIPADWRRLSRERSGEILLWWLALAGCIVAFVTLQWWVEAIETGWAKWGVAAGMAILFAVALVALWRWPPYQLAAAILMFLSVVIHPSAVKKGEAQRSYFGVYRVLLSNDGEFNILMHGTTLHGAQRVRDSQGNQVSDATPGTYYYPKSPMAQSVLAVREAVKLANKKGRYGVIGLGTGSLACMSEENEDWRFFEIDPTIITIAAQSRSFTFLASCMPQPDIVIGDARLTLAKEANGSFDLIIVDAFSSDAVPVHLMTKEALEIYRDKITDNGVAVLHISNRYLDLERVAGATVKAVPGLFGAVVSDDEADGSYASTTSTIVVIAKREEALESFRQMVGHRELKTYRTQRAWTDDYSDILGPFMAKLGRAD